MFTIEELIELNRQGFIAGPLETEDQFKKRVELTKEVYQFPQKLNANITITKDNKIKKPFWSWTKAQLKNFYDFSPEYFLGYFNNKNLRFFEGAATWQIEQDSKKTPIPILQVKKGLKKGSYFSIYQIEEILSHEAVHAARAAFSEPKFEEHLAYLTSSSIFRRILGPIFQSPKESLIFVVLLGLTLFFQTLAFIDSFFFPLFSFCSISCFIYAIWGLKRLFWRRWVLLRAKKKLKIILKDSKKAQYVLLRLTDKEIQNFSRWKTEKIYLYFVANVKKSVRFQQLYCSYFSKLT